MASRPPAAGHGGSRDWGEASWEDRAEELTFIDEDDRLPWLDSPDDVTGNRRSDSGRLIGLALLGAALLALLGAGVWWLVARNSGPVPDGSVIAAPEGPYKVRPANPGGKEHAGTGDTSFAVGEGQTREARLAEQTPVVAPAPAAEPDVEEETTAPAPAPTATPEPSGVGVQVGAYYSEAAAQSGWNTLNRQTEALQGVRYRVVRGQADIGTVYRLQAVAPDRAAAEQLCAALKADGLPCQVKR